MRTIIPGSCWLASIVLLLSNCSLHRTTTQPDSQITTSQEMTNTTPTNISDSLIIPDYPPLDVPYSQWQRIRHEQLLEANGIDPQNCDWKEVVKHPSGLLREAAFYLLVHPPKGADSLLLKRALSDSETAVQSLASFGLYLLGDTSHIGIIRINSDSQMAPGVSVFLSAGLLGELGYPEGFDIIEEGVNNSEEYIQLFAAHNAYLFFAVRDEIPFWAYYEKTLNHPNERVRIISRLQLEEFGVDEAHTLLER